MHTIILYREDINNPLHPYMWESICDDLGLSPEGKHGEYPDSIEIKVAKAKAAD